MSVGSLQFSFGKAEVDDVTKCVGDVSVLCGLQLKFFSSCILHYLH